MLMLSAMTLELPLADGGDGAIDWNVIPELVSSLLSWMMNSARLDFCVSTS